MIQKGKRFLGLSPKEKFFFLEAYIWLGLIRAAILLMPFRRITRSLNHSQDGGKPDTLTDEQLDTAKLVGRAIRQAAGSTPWESTCLVQAITAQNMLKKRNIPGLFYLGVMKDHDTGGKIKAHAWSQCGETIITGEKEHESFTILSVFAWGRK